MELHDLRTGIIVNRDRMEVSAHDGREVLYIPAWLALLALPGITHEFSGKT